MADAYAVSIHWALTQFTPATNNVAPVTVAERPLLLSLRDCDGQFVCCLIKETSCEQKVS